MKKFLACLITLSMLPLSFVSANAGVSGDVTGDGQITAADAAAALQIVLNNGEYVADADVDGNNVIDSTDVAIILQKALDITYKMPVESTETTTEETTITTETTTETTTIADDVISSNVEVTPASFPNDYFKAVGGLHSSTNADKIRINKENAITFKVAEGANIYVNAKHASTTDESLRTVLLTDSKGATIASEDYEMVPGSAQADPGVERLYAVNVPAGTYTLLSAGNHLNVYSIRITFDKIETTEATTEATTEYEVPSEITTTGNRVEVTDFASLKSAINEANVDIYVMNDIDCTESLRLSKQNANVNIIGVTQADGSSPSLNYAVYTNSLKSNPGESGTGIRISGSYYSFENLIVENAANCGMRVKGSRAGHVFVKDCVFRYNNNSGVSVTAGGEYTTFIGVDSYRNGDIIQNFGDDADGFSVKVNAGDNHYFYNCRSWDNSDDGWDSFDYQTGGFVGKISYIECLAWHNGKQESFTGEYDYRMGYPLDKDLTYVKAILAADPDFETKYNNKEVTEWPKVTMSLLGCTRSYDELYSRSWGGNPNGFKFGSIYTPNTSYRYVENCIAFDNTSKGYDQNNSKAQFDLVNGISFDNGRNYLMSAMTCNSQTGNALSFGAIEKDTMPANMTTTTPSDAEQEAIRTSVHNYRDTVMEMLRSDKVPGVTLTGLFN